MTSTLTVRISSVLSLPRMNVIKAVGQSVLGTGLDKPAYTVVKKEDGYEERRYAAAKWVSTKVSGIELDAARTTGFWRLFKYIDGENEKGTKVAMTAPVATRIVPGEGPNCENHFTVSFYIPPSHQEAPYAPTNPEVYIDQWPEQTIYAQGFGGFAKEAQFVEKAQELGEKIKDKGIDQNVYFAAGYDSPFKLFNRLNEVWFLKKEN